MKKRTLYTACALLLAATGAMAQTTADTTQVNSSTADVQYLSSSVEGQYRIQQLAGANDTLAVARQDTLNADRVPAKLLRVLKKDEQYNGWETAGIHLDEDTNLYMVSVMRGNRSRTYGFNVYGKPVLITESIRKGSSWSSVDMGK